MILFGRKTTDSSERWIFSTSKGTADTHMIDAEPYTMICTQHFPIDAGKSYKSQKSKDPKVVVWYQQICGQCKKPILPHSWVIKEDT